MKSNPFSHFAAISGFCVAAISLGTSAHADVLAYEGFGNATDFGAVAGYTPNGTASSGLTGSYTQHQGGAATYLLDRAGSFVGITDGYTPNIDGTKQQWVEHSGWNLSRLSISLASSVDLSVDGTYYMSFFSRAASNDHVAQIGLTDGTNELMWGRGYGGAAAKGITAYYGAAGTPPITGGNGTEFAYDNYETVLYVAKLVKTNSGTTNDLTVSIKLYDLSDNGTIDSSDPSSWLRTVALTGVNSTFTALQYKIDGGGGNYPSMDEFRLGNTWTDVTGVATPTGWTWTNTAGGSWASSGDWTPTGPANGADQAALINTLDITGDQSISLNGSYAIGTASFGDIAGNDGNWILNTGIGGNPLILSAPTNGSPGITVTNQTTTVNAVLTGTQGMTKKGAGILVLGSTNTYTGGTFINAGSVRIGNATAIPSGAGKGNVTVNSTLNLNDTSITLNGLIGAGSVTNSGIGTPTLTLGGDNATASFGGVIGNGTGTTNVTKTGTGIQTLTGNNTYSGTTTVNDGTLTVQGAQSWQVNGSKAGNTIIVNSPGTLRTGENHQFGWSGTLANLTVNNGGTLDLNDKDNYIGTLTLNGDALFLNGTTAGKYLGLSGGAVNYTGTGVQQTTVPVGLRLQNSDPAPVAVTFTVNGTNTAGDLVVSGVISDAGSLIKAGIGTLMLSGDNTYTGNTIVNDGNLLLDYFGSLTFKPTTNGVSNKVTGPGSAEFDGTFLIDLTTADTTNGNQWTLVDVTSNSYTPGDFIVDDFDTIGDGLHTMTNGNLIWTFSEITGVLSLQNTGATDYDTWIGSFTFDLGANTTPTGDPDNDGLTNDEEYAFGLAPNDGASVNPITFQLNKTAGTFTYTRRDNALTTLTYKVWTSPDLAVWTQDTSATQDDAAGPNGVGVEPVVVTLSATKPLAATKLFVRVTAD